MGKRKMKLSVEERIRLVEKCIRKEIRISQAAREGGVSWNTIFRWIQLYENEGPLGLMPTRKNRVYSAELKMNAVIDFIMGKDSQEEIVKKYGLRNRCQLLEWLKVYNTHKDFKSERSGSKMSKTRETTPEERLNIVMDCLENSNNYGAMAAKYQVSYQNVYNWVKKYNELGFEGLEDRRGQRKAKQVSRTPNEKHLIELAKLQKENEYLKIENDILKKFQELERRDHWGK